MDEEEPLVTPKDIFREVVKLVGHMEGVDARNRAADEIHKDHEARIRITQGQLCAGLTDCCQGCLACRPQRSAGTDVSAALSI